MNLNGIMLVSTVLNFQTIWGGEGNDLPHVLYLPSYAAAAWYHKKLPKDLLGKPLGEVLAEAEARFKTLRVHNVTTKLGDGWQGWPEAAPFDAIIVTCAPEDVPAPLVAQLREGGRLCIPVGPAGATQELLLLVKRADGTLERKSSLPVRFVSMRRAAP